MTKTVRIILAFLFVGLLPVSAQEVITNNDDEFALPEGMLENTDSLIQAWNLSKIFQLDSAAQAQSAGPTFDNAVYADRLSRIPNIMKMTYNDLVQKYIDQYTGRLRHSVSYMLGVANFYIPILEEALAYHQIPLELKFLPVIESAFNPRARSRAGAVGLWQFMLTTGKQYGLEVNSLLDERCDPIKASYAAAHYLKDLYELFGDWTLVIAAYNCGPNNITKAIQRAGGETDYWKICPYLPRETQGYVPAFIAANYIMNYYNEHNIEPMHANIPIRTDTLIVDRDVRMDKIAEVCNIDLNELRILNPQYNTNLIPGYKTKCTLRMPQKQLLAFIDLQDSICVEKEVDLASVNNALSAEATVKKNIANNRRTTSRTTTKKSGGTTVTVRRGDTLGAIAKRNHTTVARLRSLNGIKGNNIQAGKKLRVK